MKKQDSINCLRRFVEIGIVMLLVWTPHVIMADLFAGFDTSVENWTASDGAPGLVWEEADGQPDGHLRGSWSGPTNLWYFVSPPEWAGDWAGYKTIRFYLAIPSVHYPTNDSAGVLVIKGTNGMQMTWNGPTPLWTWTYYEIGLTPAEFGVSQETFDGVMAGVSELRILAEYAASTETVALDSVLVTTNAPTVFTEDLRTTFTIGTTEGWGVVDDANIAVVDEGRPSWSLRGSEFQSGEYFKVCSPAGWAGDWSGFTEIRFDMKWTSTSANAPQGAMLTLFGANGRVVTWTAIPARDVWQHYVVPLTPEAFNVSADYLNSILSHVMKIWIHGEFGAGRDVTFFDNITVATGPHTPVVHSTSLLSRFGSDDEGWVGFDGAAFSWDPAGGFLGSGAAKVADAGSGTARFQSPDAWAGDWRAFDHLRFMIRGSSGYTASIWIADFEGNALRRVFSEPYSMWTPFTVDLTPENFGTNAVYFEKVMSNVACLWINADGALSLPTWLDEVSLLPAAEPGSPPERSTTFDTDAEGWTRGNLSSGNWAAPAAVHWYYGATDNPSNCVVNGDGGTGTTVFYSPAAWTGDWRGYKSVAFDMNIVQGSQAYMNQPGAMIWLVSAQGVLVANWMDTPPVKSWDRFYFDLNPAAFGVTQAEYDLVARDVVFLAIRSEWQTGTAEREALDNVVLSTNLTPYWAWLDDFLPPPALLDPAMAGVFMDADQDGTSNWTEFVAGTNPTNSLDFLGFERISRSGTNCILEFQSRAGRLYGIQRSPLLSPATWSLIKSNLAGTDLLLSVPIGMSGIESFYRLQVRQE